ncbi:hypothetical protein EZV73_02735 [Acidaminobacter sp. JC074]|uniref:hypothetical protein n=1 Tax=Acidaminobacter sp. JC074 TaxID=2530199 RepID=UPI001F0F4A60|nr:hypothetical protein [Acidaminobacter sp. JC074]MCH4886463.1 hypothetical protein [Acidaminobacter sp. JC074]
MNKETFGINLLRFPFLLIMVTVYLFIGLFYKVWHPTWMLLIPVPFYYHYALSRVYPQFKKTLFILPLLTLVTSVYVFIGMSYSLWHPTWMIYLLTVLVIWFILIKK